MPSQMQATVSPLTLVKVILWIVVVVTATILLHRRKVTTKVRLAFLVGGVLLFGFVFGLVAGMGIDPNPVMPVRGMLTAVIVRHQIALSIIAMPVIYLVMVFISNKSI